MEVKDLLVTPIFLIVIFFFGYFIRPFVTDFNTKRYFFPALTLKIVGAISLGLIYQYYYGGGDTFTYFNLGSKYIWEAFNESPILGLKLIFAGEEYSPDTFQYASKIYTYGDLASYFVVRIAGIFDIITFHTYSATAVLFAIGSFSGIWAMFMAFYRQYPTMHLKLAIACFFIPSLFFWGSGILKDTLTIGAVGWFIFCLHKIFFEKRQIVIFVILMLVASYILYTVKIYILLCLIPSSIIWVLSHSLRSVRNVILRAMVAPFIIFIAILSGTLAVKEVGEDNSRYNIENLAYTAKVSAEWIHYVSTREGGSAYTLGDFDYSPTGMIKKFPLAIWVTLYRPYLWESHNLVMILSALENTILLIFTIYIVFKSGFFRSIKLSVSQPVLLFCFTFSVAFAFAVGISTYNFGSLVRYKIPMLPLFVMGLFLLYHHAKREKKLSLAARTENL